jgi:hypothetical protein
MHFTFRTYVALAVQGDFSILPLARAKLDSLSPCLAASCDLPSPV